MAHIIEVERNSEAEARSFLDALYYSDSVSAIGFRLCNKTVRVVAVNWYADEESELDERISQLITDTHFSRATIWTKSPPIAAFFQKQFSFNPNFQTIKPKD